MSFVLAENAFSTDDSRQRLTGFDESNNPVVHDARYATSGIVHAAETHDEFHKGITYYDSSGCTITRVGGNRQWRNNNWFLLKDVSYIHLHENVDYWNTPSIGTDEDGFLIFPIQRDGFGGLSSPNLWIWPNWDINSGNITRGVLSAYWVQDYNNDTSFSIINRYVEMSESGEGTRAALYEYCYEAFLVRTSSSHYFVSMADWGSKTGLYWREGNFPNRPQIDWEGIYVLLAIEEWIIRNTSLEPGTSFHTIVPELTEDESYIKFTTLGADGYPSVSPLIQLELTAGVAVGIMGGWLAGVYAIPYLSEEALGSAYLTEFLTKWLPTINLICYAVDNDGPAIRGRTFVPVIKTDADILIDAIKLEDSTGVFSQFQSAEAYLKVDPSLQADDLQLMLQASGKMGVHDLRNATPVFWRYKTSAETYLKMGDTVRADKVTQQATIQMSKAAAIRNNPNMIPAIKKFSDWLVEKNILTQVPNTGLNFLQTDMPLPPLPVD